MSICKFLVLLVALFAAATAEDGNDPVTQLPVVSSSVVDAPVPPADAPQIITLRPPPEPTKPTTAPTPPTTSTTTTTTTTPKPTTPAPPAPPAPPKTTTTTTTEPPPTTSTAKPTPKPTPPPPTPKPTPPPPTPQPKPPKMEVQKWSLAKGNDTCILVKMAVQFEIPYITTKNESLKGYVNFENATVTGSCDASKSTLVLHWGDNNTLTLNFAADNKTYEVKSIAAVIIPDSVNFPNNNYSGSSVIMEHAGNEFEVALKKSYKCVRQQEICMNSTLAANETLGLMHVSDVQVQAFYMDKPNFLEAVNCAPAPTPDIVPIAAGITLAVLIVIILVGYLLGRRRAQVRGYLSMFTANKREEDYIPMKNLSCFN